MATFAIGERRYGCPLELTLSAVGGKWKILILWRLRDGVRRYGEIRRALPGVTDKMLAQQLRELEADGVVHRQVYAVVPPRVEYSLTSEGERLVPVLRAMQQWGMAYKEATNGGGP